MFLIGCVVMCPCKHSVLDESGGIYFNKKWDFAWRIVQLSWGNRLKFDTILGLSTYPSGWKDYEYIWMKSKAYYNLSSLVLIIGQTD